MRPRRLSGRLCRPSRRRHYAPHSGRYIRAWSALLICNGHRGQENRRPSSRCCNIFPVPNPSWGNFQPVDLPGWPSAGRLVRASEGQHGAVRWDRSPVDFPAPCCLPSRRKNGERDARLSRGSIAPAFANCVGDSVSAKICARIFWGLRFALMKFCNCAFSG